MSDLISRSEVWKAFISRVDSICDLEDVREILDSIPTAEPTIDIVRCGECEYADEYNHCKYSAWWNGNADFCSHGIQRKENR